MRIISFFSLLMVPLCKKVPLFTRFQGRFRTPFGAVFGVFFENLVKNNAAQIDFGHTKSHVF